jgi:hypothetical protein
MKFLGLNFAHLRGLKAAPRPRRCRCAAENPEDECEDEEDMQAEQSAEEAEADGAGCRRRQGKDGKKGKAKKAKKKPDDETDGDSDDDGEATRTTKRTARKPLASDLRKSFARGRKFERARGTAIFASPAAANNVELAAKLAFDGEYANLSPQRPSPSSRKRAAARAKA